MTPKQQPFKYNVHLANGNLRAGVYDPRDAACLVDAYGTGSTIRYHTGAILWTEGCESQTARESGMEDYDFVAETMRRREISAVRGMN